MWRPAHLENPHFLSRTDNNMTLKHICQKRWGADPTRRFWADQPLGLKAMVKRLLNICWLQIAPGRKKNKPREYSRWCSMSFSCRELLLDPKTGGLLLLNPRPGTMGRHWGLCHCTHLGMASHTSCLVGDFLWQLLVVRRLTSLCCLGAETFRTHFVQSTLESVPSTGESPQRFPLYVQSVSCGLSSGQLSEVSHIPDYSHGPGL